MENDALFTSFLALTYGVKFGIILFSIAQYFSIFFMNNT